MNIHSAARPRVTPALILAICAIGGLFSAGAHARADAPHANAGPAVASAPEQTRIKTVVIPVEGMSCVACVARVKKTLVGIGGVTEVQVNLVERNARVRFDSARVSPEGLVDAINKLGYRAGVPARVGS